MIKVRFAPSPTGHLHVGNAKTALVNYLFALKEKGAMILRIEDTDLERSDASYEASIIDDLKWLGIKWDEGPTRQTERFDLYRTYVNSLLDKGGAYRCFCSQEELEKSREASLKKGEPPRYSGACRKYSAEEALALEKSGKPCVIRFNSPHKPVTFRDIIHGEISFPRDHVDDFILMKQERTPSYNFAVVIDDMDMAITHVIRGADHISNTPKQIMLFEAFGKTPPLYAHHSLLVGSDKKPLSKRHGVTKVKDFRDMGILREALTNYLAIIGRSVAKEVMDIDEIAESFTIGSLSKADSFFDMEKLLWLNKEYIRKMPVDGLLRELGLGPEYREKIAALRENAATLEEMKGYLAIFDTADISEEGAAHLSQTGDTKGLIGQLKDLVERETPFESIVETLGASTSLKRKDFFMTLRTALTGRKSGPPLKDIFPLIPKEIIMERIGRCLNM